MFAVKKRVLSGLGVLGLIAVTGCSAQYSNHGYVPPEEELADLVVGVDNRATVDDVIGAPSTSGVRSDGDYYYIRSRIRKYGVKKPEVVERQVLAISFNESDTIKNIERFSLADGNIVPLARRVTETSVKGRGFLKQLLGNIGNFDPSDILN
ncbi:SmpA / OmlA family protein [Roseovarius albus]|uniref:SmpA / OmlA family protein n=1 Tax=Roseovarius albus TaxID=1247867 RepID=A0A1X6YCM8_9RHOB|nr:outer membrane protein assembly factor BamE [Roseovarius albus]SLN16845.1 SmpA / OmlA family protein [Roseovarius albus]